jgi:hypothetical protein
MTKDYLKKLISVGYSVIPCHEHKAPIEEGWTKAKTKTADDIDKFNPYYWGCRTGYNDIECIDVDLKVFSSLPDRKEWWNEYLNFLSDNIENFIHKVVIAKTKKGGFHILYKTKIKKGNTKIASLKGMKEAIIETRGVGGQFILYGEFLNQREYHHIDYITDEEREILWSISKTYDYKDPILAEVPKKSEYKKVDETDITPWDDYNEKHTAFDVINDEFTIVRNTSKTYVIKRHGATSPHSGYVFKDSGCLFLFSTGTIYPNEKLLSPFNLYTIKYHNGDYAEATKELYKQNYGTRRVKKIELPEIKIEKQDPIKRAIFPIEIFPNEIQHFIIESSITLGMSTDYMGCAFMWMLSLIVGNSMVIEVKPGWKEVATLWIAVVGKPGIGKTPSINQMIAPLRSLNVKEQKDYQKNYQKFIDYEALDKKNKEYCEEVKKPKNKQFIVGDVTIEALVDLHEENPNAIGIFKDELAGWFKDMNKYRAGSDLEFWLSSWSGSPISLNRKTSKNAFVDKPFIPVLGGIQPSIFDEFSNGANKENGFVDRILISYPELTVNHYNNSYISAEALEWYNDFVVSMKTNIEKLFLKFDENDQIQPEVVKFEKESEREWIRIHDKYTDIQNSDNENEYMKSMLPKQKSYIPRFALLLNTLWSFTDENYKSGFIHTESILRAEKLSEYFVNMAKLVKQDAKEKFELKNVAKDKQTNFDKFKAMYEADPNLNRTVVAEMLDVSRKSIYQWINKIENK